MVRRVSWAFCALSITPFFLVTDSVEACSCVQPTPRMLTPAHGKDVPLNAHVRVMLPVYPAGKLVLRKHRGDDVPAKRIDSPLNNMSYVDLVPEKPLDADTRYELALVRPDQHPSTLVFGTFVTGKAQDTVAPAAPKIIRSQVNAYRGSAMTSCAVHTPWAEVFLNEGHDPDRPDAQLLYAVWSSGSKGKIDLNGPPTAFLSEDRGKLTLGRQSYCDPNEFPLPTAGTITVAIASVDESGNRSAVQQVRLAMSTPVEARQ